MTSLSTVVKLLSNHYRVDALILVLYRMQRCRLTLLSLLVRDAYKFRVSLQSAFNTDWYSILSPSLSCQLLSVIILQLQEDSSKKQMELKSALFR